MQRVSKLVRGILLCLVIAVPSWLLGKQFDVIAVPSLPS